MSHIFSEKKRTHGIIDGYKIVMHDPLGISKTSKLFFVSFDKNYKSDKNHKIDKSDI